MSTIPEAAQASAGVARPDDARSDGDAARGAPGGSDVRAIKGYSVPGEGSTTVISIVTVIALLVLWWVATHFGWIKDLFLPTPEKIITSFGEAWRGDIQGGKPLTE